MKSRLSLLNSNIFQATCAFIIGYLLSTELIRLFVCPGKHRIAEKGGNAVIGVRTNGGDDFGTGVHHHHEEFVNLTTAATTHWDDEVQMNDLVTVKDEQSNKSTTDDRRMKIGCFILHEASKPAQVVHTSWIPSCDVNMDLDIRQPFPGSKGQKSFLKEMLSVATVGGRLDYYLLAPHDVYIVMDNLREYLSHCDPDQPLAYGHALVRRLGKDGMPLYTVGGTLVLSREALLRIAETRKCSTKKIPDTTRILTCLHGSGGNLVDSRDQFAKNTFLAPVRPFQILTGSMDDKFVKEQKFSTNHCESPSCLSDFPIAFHKMTSNEIHLLHFLINWSNYSHFTGTNKYFKLRLRFNGSRLPVVPHNATDDA